jgi:hypothetical protein
VDDGCCGTYTCDACCKSCTQGYYGQNNTCNGLTVGGTPLNNLPFPCTTGALYTRCKAYDANKNGILTIGEMLTAKGNDVVCAQAAAAYLNQKAIGTGSCADGLVFTNGNGVCAATDLTKLNAQLTFINEGSGNGEHCPFKGCKK